MVEAITLMLQEQQEGGQKGELKEELKDELRLQHKHETLIKDREHQKDTLKPVNLTLCLPDPHLASMTFRMTQSSPILQKYGQN